MDKLGNLNKRLRVIASLLDGTASNIRDAPLSPTNDNIRHIGEALFAIYEIQRSIYKLRPELEIPYEEPPEEIAAANKRLGEALIQAYDLADDSKLAQAVGILTAFEKDEPSDYHRSLAAGEIQRLTMNYET